MGDLHTATAAEAFTANPIIAPLILDFLTWLAAGPRPYAEVMEAWRTSCPRLTVWEDAMDAGYVRRAGALVELTAAGREVTSQ